MDHDDLLNKLELWQNFKETNASISDRLKLVSLDDDLKIFMKKKEIDIVEDSIEEPLFLSIISKSGMSLFTYFFSEEWEKKDLFSSFMTAFNTFSKEFFSKTLDRVKIGENTIIMMPFNQNFFCYVIRGQTFPALNRLNQLLIKIHESKETMDNLNAAMEKNVVLNLNAYPKFKNIIESVFKI